jgi:outer membrane biosynthesis protein TonB
VARLFPTSDWVLAGAIAVSAQGSFVVMLARGEAKPVLADMSDENRKPVSVQIVPIVDDLPTLKLGGKPSTLPDMWQKPKSMQKAGGESAVSTKADTENAPTNKSDAGVTDAVSVDPIAGDAASDPNASEAGSAAGSKTGTETDPAKAHAIDQYKAQLNAWFSARFNIKGKVPWETLKNLKAIVVIDITPDRKVGGYDVVKGSGNDAFDDQLYRDLAKVQVGGAVLPPPPENYPDILGTKQRLSFQCTVQAACE